jgi:diguanylate cyclase (GGDEF)-like protein/PAS domain S-box-containing protein
MSTLLRKRRFVWFVALGLLVILAASGYFSGRRYLEASEWVTHTFEVTEAIDAVLSSVQEVENGQRGFLLSGDPAFLGGYAAARAALPAELEHLRALSRDNPVQQGRIEKLDAVIAAKLAFSAKTIELEQSGGDSAGLIKSGRGRLLMDQVRAIALEMRGAEKQLLAARTERAAGAQRQTVLMSLLGVAITLGLVLFSLAVVHRDLRELRGLSEDLAVAEKMFRELAENASELVLLVDIDGRVTYVSPSCQRLLGYEPAEFQALEPASLVEAEDLDAVRAWVQGMLDGGQQLGSMNLRYRTKRGEFRWFDVSATILRDGTESAPSILLSARDIHERRLAQDALEQKKGELEELSATDGLTGLLNRRGFMERALKALEGSRVDERSLAIVFVDLDGLKPINDQLGHEAGDRAISEAARVLRQICRGGDLVARLGGDEFAVLAHDLTTDGFGFFKNRVEGALRNLNAESDRPFQLGFSLGAAFWEATSDESLDSLLKRADATMYEEKRRRKAARAS